MLRRSSTKYWRRRPSINPFRLKARPPVDFHCSLGERLSVSNRFCRDCVPPAFLGGAGHNDTLRGSRFWP